MPSLKTTKIQISDDLMYLVESLQRAIQSLRDMHKCAGTYDFQDNLVCEYQFQSSLDTAKAISNSSNQQVKSFLISIFASIHSLSGATEEADRLYVHFCHCMEQMYGPGHIVLSDCYSQMAAARAADGRISDASQVSCVT